MGLFGFSQKGKQDDRPQPPTGKEEREAEYGVLLERVLAGVAQGWDRSRVLAELGDRVDDSQFYQSWLAEKFGMGLLKATTRDEELARRLKQLGRLDCGQVSEIAGQLATELLQPQNSEAAPASDSETPQTERPRNETAEFCFQQGNAQYMAGDFTAALASYDHALQHKPDYHEAWNNRGTALVNLRLLEEAIASYDHALQHKPHFHEAWFNRGYVLSNLGKLEEAVVSYDHALRHKLDFHEAWFKRGITLGNLGRFGEAVVSYDHALQHKPDKHEAWNNRGTALVNLGRFEEAVVSYDHALRHKPDKHEAWSNRGNSLVNLGRFEEAIVSYNYALHHRLDLHEAWSNRGNSLVNLGQFEEAIVSYDYALHHKPDFHEAWIGRGSALGNLTKREVLFVPYRRSPMLQALALNEPGYGGQIATYQEGLRYIRWEQNPEGWGSLHRAIGRTHYFKGRSASNSTPYYRQALKSYETALQTLEAFPESHLELAQDLIRVHLALGHVVVANDWRKKGLRLLGDLLNAAPSPTQKRQLELKFSGFSQIGVDVLVQAKQPITALETADRYKNRCLLHLLHTWQEQTINPSHAQIRELLTPTTAIVFWHLSPHALTTFLLLPHQSEPIPFSTAPDPLTQWQKDWDHHYQDYRSKKFTNQPDDQEENHPWRKTLPAKLTQLSNLLDLTTLEPHLANLTHLILVPHRDLHRFPLPALFPHHTCTILPSLQVGLSLQSRQPCDPTIATLLSVEDPAHSDPMRFAQLESAVIRQLFATGTTIAPHQATQARVLTELQHGHDIFHFTGHGTYNFHQPENSAIGLVDGNLTARAISQLPLSRFSLISLAACETALTGRETIETEYVGLPSAFLQAGATHVLSTLWNVKESSSAWFMIHFYQLFCEGVPPADALHQTQHWLQTLTHAKLVIWLRQLRQLQGLSRGTQEFLDQTVKATEETSRTIGSSACPYAHPYFWAAFTLSGKV